MLLPWYTEGKEPLSEEDYCSSRRVQRSIRSRIVEITTELSNHLESQEDKNDKNKMLKNRLHRSLTNIGIFIRLINRDR